MCLYISDILGERSTAMNFHGVVTKFDWLSHKFQCLIKMWKLVKPIKFRNDTVKIHLGRYLA